MTIIQKPLNPVRQRPVSRSKEALGKKSALLKLRASSGLKSSGPQGGGLAFNWPFELRWVADLG